MVSVSAAFERLCVETVHCDVVPFGALSAAFERLCVETLLRPKFRTSPISAAFERLCVETPQNNVKVLEQGVSRLRAAVC